MCDCIVCMKEKANKVKKSGIRPPNLLRSILRLLYDYFAGGKDFPCTAEAEFFDVVGKKVFLLFTCTSTKGF